MYNHTCCSFEEYLQINKRLVSRAHAAGAAVEAEVGDLPEADTATETVSGGVYTDPEQAAQFISQTNLDALSVAVGNIHVLENAKANLDLDLIRCLRERIEVPLVLHGGTGIDPQDLKQAIGLGISKVNVGSVLRRAYVNALQEFIRNNEISRIDPGSLTSTGGSQDMLYRARMAVKDEVIRLMELLGSAGKIS